MSDKRNIRVGITQGDTNGIGYEIILKAFDNQEMFVLALDQTDPLQENEDILQALSEHFYITQQGAYKIGQDPAAQLSELGYTQGAEAPEEDEEYILLSSIDKKANQNADDILAGKA
jgi:4-hydroxy-L-threonine phosphate dehydrogenase PdxA